ncbi:hypothetical protein A2716_01930 [candidate division WWE3 bacterium RIFCSPHIGHO2_01_FULL_40_23]|uniref:Uncharacterized protein n=1 Tax=candidate division WWE3 bacterium RIFCSPLOWO2_01_FULL_41_18 TaxID=1802625 RepID=A0A1F4VF12_UNCKA|nr:MAG: hypothetical protein A2716_01930 [candidate division WWE3 bacterium RIFCSPHIGHO2_01_FULL_40_23]OGC55749.1 MAG: hypothetical protein A3A78_01780 [candidate division WWE3 bacterium RIFCSPLOWO2_01_FULL_41_18]
MNLALKILKTYKMNLFVSLTMGIVITAVRVEKIPLNIFLIFFSSLIGTFVLEFDYFIHAYIFEPNGAFSQGLKDLMKQRNYTGVVSFIKSNRFNIPSMILYGAMFQMIMAFLSLVLVTSEGIFGISLTLSVLAQTFYKMFEEYEKHHSLSEWFWILKDKPSKSVQLAYALAMGLFLVYILSQLA